MSLIRLGGRVVDLVGLRVTGPEGEAVALSPIEAKLLAYLAANGERVVDRPELLTQVWGYHPSTESRAVDKLVHRLRPKIEDDPERPLHLIGVRGAGYRLRVADAVPAASGSPGLFGRTAEVAAITGALQAGSAVWVVGAPGMGKSSVIQRVVERSTAWPGGVLRGSPRSGIRALSALSEAIGLPTGQRAGDILRRALGKRPPSLIVVDPDDDEVDPESLDPGRKHAWLLACRREVPGRFSIKLEPLDPNAATDLLAHRFEALTGTPADRDRCHAIATKVQGIPSLLRMVAARLARDPGARPPRWIAERAGLDALSNGVLASVLALPDLLSRALAAACAWSDAFDTADVAGMLGAEVDVTQAQLEDLADAHLIRSERSRTGTPRWVVYDTVRAPVRASWSKDEATFWRDRQTEVMARWGDEGFQESLYTEGGDARQERLTLAVPDLEASLATELRRGDPERPAALWLAARTVWHNRGSGDPISLGLEILSRSRRVPTQTRIRFGIGSLFKARGALDAASDELHAALDLADTDLWRGRIWGALADLEQQRGHALLARAYTEAALALHEASGDQRWWAVRLGTRALMERREGQLLSAERTYEQSIATLVQVGDRDTAAKVGANLANILHERGQFARAEVLNLRALEVVRRRGESGSVIHILQNLALGAAWDGRLPQATAWADEARQLAGWMGHPALLDHQAMLDATIEVAAGRPASAADLLREALGRPSADHGELLTLAAEVRLALDDVAGARLLIAEAREAATSSGDPIRLAHAVALEGRLAAVDGQIDRARARLHEAEVLVSTLGLTEKAPVTKALAALVTSLGR